VGKGSILGVVARLGLVVLLGVHVLKPDCYAIQSVTGASTRTALTRNRQQWIIALVLN
jgi:hypothetical protein